uniref:Uncharacterized protein n=1 Tax=Plectus sambesii TaxID=2011161 RepID=A0A914VPF6_9BILA
MITRSCVRYAQIMKSVAASAPISALHLFCSFRERSIAKTISRFPTRPTTDRTSVASAMGSGYGVCALPSLALPFSIIELQWWSGDGRPADRLGKKTKRPFTSMSAICV